MREVAAVRRSHQRSIYPCAGSRQIDSVVSEPDPNPFSARIEFVQCPPDCGRIEVAMVEIWRIARYAPGGGEIRGQSTCPQLGERLP